ncbi:MAG: TIGR02206 family membrane protein [Candidatus Marinimicrobia bacterium]|nr:TIGR02206 family membrane protein [Candidatus Neomarinimicrobiota bacterium]
MQKFFDYNFKGEPFQIFSTYHLYGLLAVLFFAIFLIMALKKLNSAKTNEFVRYFLAAALLLQEVSLNLWRIWYGKWEVSTSLPLHLCGLGIILSSIMLVKKDYKLYEFLYFWGTAGATQALLQPDISNFGFPHYRFFQFFVSHGLLFASIIFATFVFNFRPKFKSIYKAFVITNIFAFFIGLFNFAVGSNYMFIAHKPDTPSILDFMGPWPLYILPLEFIALFLFTLVYIPFLVHDLVIKSASIETEN